MNKFICIGNLTKDVEMRTTQSGKAVANINVAVNYGYGEGKKTLFMRAIAWEKKAESVSNLTKGKKILLEGRLEQTEWTDKSGNKQTSIQLTVENIEFLSPKEESEKGYEKHYKQDEEKAAEEVKDELIIPGEEEMF
jgi:single-strand DNA-binding protein